jgi:hypothetical protein
MMVACSQYQSEPRLQIGTEGTIELALQANVIIVDLYRQHDEAAAIIAGM